MEIKYKIKELTSLIQIIEKEVDLSDTIIKFDSYEFLMKNRGKVENKFILKHRSNKERFKILAQDINHFYRQCKKILQYFEEEDIRLSNQNKDG